MLVQTGVGMLARHLDDVFPWALVPLRCVSRSASDPRCSLQ